MVCEEKDAAGAAHEALPTEGSASEDKLLPDPQSIKN
jgi:hypothetical protein